jgi:hypothetical protein
MVIFAAEEAVVHFVYFLKSKGFFAVKAKVLLTCGYCTHFVCRK